MNPQLLALALGSAVLSVALAIVLFFVKWINWRRARRSGERRAKYIAAVGEIVARGLPHGYDSGWAGDPLFHDVLMQYIDVVAGQERQHLEELITVVDLRNRLVHQLRKARRESKRMSAASYLAVIASPEVEWALIEALDSKNAEIKVQAAGGLATIRSERAVGKLVHMLLSEKPWVAARIADQLVSFGPGAVPMLMENIRDEHGGHLVEHGTIAVAIRVLGYIGDRRAGTAIEPMLEHSNLEVRIAAANALGTAGHVASVPLLIHALEDPAWQVRARAAASLGSFGDPTSLAPMAAALSDDSWWVRQNSAEALTEIVGGIDTLIDALAGGEASARDAALQQLGLSGVIRAARDRIATERGTDQDDRLVAAVELPEPIQLEPMTSEESPDEDESESEELPDNVRSLFETRAS